MVAYALAWAPVVISWPAYCARYGLMAGSSMALPDGMVIASSASCWCTWFVVKLLAQAIRPPLTNRTTATIKPPVVSSASSVRRRMALISSFGPLRTQMCCSSLAGQLSRARTPPGQGPKSRLQHDPSTHCAAPLRRRSPS